MRLGSILGYADGTSLPVGTSKDNDTAGGTEKDNKGAGDKENEDIEDELDRMFPEEKGAKVSSYIRGRDYILSGRTITRSYFSTRQLKSETGKRTRREEKKTPAKKPRGNKGVDSRTKPQARKGTKPKARKDRVQYPPGKDIWLRNCRNAFTQDHECLYCLCASCDGKMADKFKLRSRRGVPPEEREELRREHVAEQKKTEKYEDCNHTLFCMNETTLNTYLRRCGNFGNIPDYCSGCGKGL